MPRVSTELTSQYWEPVANGPVAQADLTVSAAIPASVAAGTPWKSPVLYADGFKLIAVGATLAQAGTISVQRYLDAAGTVPQGPAVSATLAANTAGVVNVVDGVPFQSFTVTITNTGSGSAALTAFAVLLNAS